MVNINLYKEQFKIIARKSSLSENDIEDVLAYASRLADNNVPIVYSPQHFCQLVGYQEDFIYSMSNVSHLFYKEYTIPKRNGGVRIIHEPYPSLKDIQKWILVNILQNLYKSHISPVAKAYISGISIKDNAKFHKRQNTVICLDISDFFPSINFNHIYSIFESLGYTKQVAVLLSNLCLRNNSLPQGSPTSPFLSNIVLKSADECLFKYAIDNGLRYTRYADDMTFSGENVDIKSLLSFARKTIKKIGFTLNKDKTKILSRASRQQVTGIVVNQGMNTPRSYRLQIRQDIYYIIKYGIEEHLKRIESPLSPFIYAKSLLGKINHTLSINPQDLQMAKYKKWMSEYISHQANNRK